MGNGKGKRFWGPRGRLLLMWAILALRAALAVAGALTARDYQMNALVWVGGVVVVGGLTFGFAAVRCPFCGLFLGGYRPFPDVCPRCGKVFLMERGDGPKSGGGADGATQKNCQGAQSQTQTPNRFRLTPRRALTALAAVLLLAVVVWRLCPRSLADFLPAAAGSEPLSVSISVTEFAPHRPEESVLTLHSYQLTADRPADGAPGASEDAGNLPDSVSDSASGSPPTSASDSTSASFPNADGRAAYDQSQRALTSLRLRPDFRNLLPISFYSAGGPDTSDGSLDLVTIVSLRFDSAGQQTAVLTFHGGGLVSLSDWEYDSFRFFHLADETALEQLTDCAIKYGKETIL